MIVEGILNTTQPWYFLAIPSLCFFYDKDQKALGVAFMWLNIVAGLQFRKNDKVVINKKD
jgi:hypothetical protein